MARSSCQDNQRRFQEVVSQGQGVVTSPGKTANTRLKRQKHYSSIEQSAEGYRYESGNYLLGSAKKSITVIFPNACSFRFSASKRWFSHDLLLNFLWLFIDVLRLHYQKTDVKPKQYAYMPNFDNVSSSTSGRSTIRPWLSSFFIAAWDTCWCPLCFSLSHSRIVLPISVEEVRTPLFTLILSVTARHNWH